MSLEKLKRTLHREFTRNPAKSCTLLALLPVAGYFIGPLVWKQFPASQEVPTAQLAQVLVTPNATGTPGDSTAIPSGLPRWQEVVEWLSQDVRMRPTTSAGTRDPFRPVAKVAESPEITEVPKEIATPLAASLRPEDCGLELTATIIGQMKRLASISGRLYAESSRVPVAGHDRGADESPAGDDAFVLKSVAKNFVVLERNGELFQLKLARGAEQ